jgi:hypothetical protein
VLEYCDQGSLRQLLNTTGPFKTPGTPAHIILHYGLARANKYKGNLHTLYGAAAEHDRALQDARYA